MPFHVRYTVFLFHYHVPEQTHEPSNSALRAFSAGDESRACVVESERDVAHTELSIEGDFRLLVFSATDSRALMWT